jgi:thiol:disulfide interchange protein DsbC
MKTKLLSLLFFAFTVSALVPAHAAPSDDAIRALFEGKLGGKVEQINKAPIAGLYEVVVDGQIMYVDEKASYFIAGNLVDTKTMKNLTADKKAELSDKKLAKLPYENAIKQVRGNGKNVMVTFEDPNCGYCKKLANELKQVKNVTIYTFLIPILSDDSAEKSKAIWCSSDRAKSWNDWMTNNVAPVAAAGGKCDPNPMLDSNMKLSQSLGVRGTPFIYFPATKQQVGGYIPAAEIEKNLAKAGS